MNPQEIIKAAIDLLDDFDADPRSPVMRGLASLLAAPDDIPGDTEIELVATIAPGGKCSVADQHGRALKGVKSVSSFRDQAGVDVMQIIL